MKIRVACAADAPRLLEIYAPYVRETAITFECETPTAEEFEGRIASTLKAYPYLVAEEEERIVGYAYASPFHDRAAYRWSAEVSIYVDRAYHRMGIGRKLYQSLEELLKRQGVTNLNACIAYPNPSSIAFHEKEGYRLVGHFTQCGYKQGRWWDIVWMEKMIGPHTIPPRPWRPFRET